MANSLLKTTAHNSFADSIYSEIMSRASRYYYFLGKTLPWSNESLPPPVIDSMAYDRSSRDEIIAFKEITPSDISYIIPRINWVSNTIYDNYDDQYSSEIQGLNLTSGGSLYLTTPTITIGSIVPVSTLINANSQYYYNGYLYTVKTTGTTGSNNAILLGVIGSNYTHGSAILSCVGIQATATCSLGISGANNQKVITTSIVNRGYGYSSVPTVTFSSGAASASAIVKIGSNGSQKLENTLYYAYSDSNIYICIDNNNKGVSSVAPTGVSSGYLTTADGYTWKYMSTVNTNKFLVNDFLPVNTVSKDKFSASGSIINVSIDNRGSNYVSGSTAITISGDGTGASVSPIITDGSISGVQVNSSGINYTYANFVVVGVGKNAAVSSSISTNITNQYSQQAQVEYDTINGNICSIQMVSGGYGYTNPSISIIGDGSGATATATISGGAISKITIGNRGTNYNWATIIISDSVGTGAIARAVVSPFGGLGKDPINQFSCNNLMFYTKIDNNTNQGFVITNDYRQLGIIKNPIRYDTGTYLTSNFASTCWKITAFIAINSSIVVDSILTSISNSVTYRFRVVAVSGFTVLLIPLDNGIPTSNMEFLLTPVIRFMTESVVPPSANKYSGDLLYVGNEAAFVATSASPAVLRTIITL